MMKNNCVVVLIILVLALAFLSNGCKGKIFKNEEVYQRIKDIVPKNWKVEEQGNKFVIIRNESVWFYNPINMPPFLEEKEFEDYVKKWGNKGQYELYLEYVDKWSEEKTTGLTRKNDSIYTEIQNLPEKCKISHLSHKFDSYIGNTDEEKKRVKEYEKIKENLESEIQRVPDFNTENFSIFISDNTLWPFDIYPLEASQEIFNFEEQIKKKR